MKASFCYQVVTPESAEHGDYAEHGWILPGHWEFPLDDEDGYHEETLKDAQAGEFDLTDLSTVVRFAQELGICSDEGADWFYSVDPDQDYRTGEDRTYSLHLRGVTESTKRRILRLIQDF